MCALSFSLCVCIYIKLNVIERRRKKKTVCGGATTHKSFDIINIIKVIVTTLSVPHFFPIHLHMYELCVCIYKCICTGFATRGARKETDLKYTDRTVTAIWEIFGT